MEKPPCTGRMNEFLSRRRTNTYRHAAGLVRYQYKMVINVNYK